MQKVLQNAIVFAIIPSYITRWFHAAAAVVLCPLPVRASIAVFVIP